MLSRSAGLLLPVLLTLPCFSQDYRGRVQGVISDTQNAAIAQAVVTLQNTNTRATTTRTTDEYGRYLFDFVEPGTYSLQRKPPGLEDTCRRMCRCSFGRT